MQQPHIPPTTEAKNRFIDFTSLQFWKGNLSLIVIIPYILGGIWQIVELSTISLTYIRFFSVTQSVSDGLLMLIILFLIFSSWFVIKRRDVTERLVRKWLMVDDKMDVKIIVNLITGLLFVFLLSPIWIALYNISMAASGRNDIFYFFLIGAVMWLAIYLSKDRYKNSPAKNLLQKTKVSTFNWLRFALLLGFIAYCISFLIFIFNVWHLAFAFPSNNLNFIHQQELVKARVPDAKVKPLYFNDNYFFGEATATDSSKIVIVTRFDKLVSDTIPVIQEHEVSEEETDRESE